MSDVDTIFVNGSAFSAGWRESRRLGLALSGGRIAAVGPDSDLLAAAGARTQVVDLAGGMVLPGFVDAHVHPVQAGVELLRCDLTRAYDAAGCLAEVRSYAEANPEEPWILGGGWTMPHFPGGIPSADLLDAVVPDRPVALFNRDHHGLWVNSLALRLAGIDDSTPDPAAGRIERDHDGHALGTLHEAAMGLVLSVVPDTSAELGLRGLLAAQEYLLSQGITGWQDAKVDHEGGLDILGVYRTALERELLRARVTAALWWERGIGMEQLQGLVERRGEVASLGRAELLSADQVKIMVDGVAENFTAAMSRPYLDGCGHPTSNSGATFFTPEAVTDAVAALDAAGFGVHFHALGDRAVTIALDALDSARRSSGRLGSRHHLAHLQILGSADVPRFAQLGATANLQMLWGAWEDQLADLTFPFLEADLFARHYPFADLVAAGARLAAGSDWPVSSPTPMEAIAVGVTRAVPGTPADPRIRPTLAIDLASALSAYTAGSAFVNGRDATTGRLRQGYLADLALLDADPFRTETEDLHRISIRQTWLGGELVFQR